MKNNFKLEVVSAHEKMFSGDILFVVAPGGDGELGIFPNHTPLITRIKPGELRYKNSENIEEVMVIAGGILEIQPSLVTVLADTAIRAKDLDEERASQAKENAERIISENDPKVDLAKAHAELAFAIAELSTIRKYRGKK